MASPYRCRSTPYVEKCEDSDAQEELSNLAATLSLTDADTKMVREGVLAPKLDLKLAEALRSNDLSDLKEWISQVDCPENLVKDKYVRAYTDKLRMSEAIPSPERTEELAGQASFGLTDDDVYPANSTSTSRSTESRPWRGRRGGGIVNDEYKGATKLSRHSTSRMMIVRACGGAKQRLKPSSTTRSVPSRKQP